MSSLSFNPKKIIRGIFRRHKSEKACEAKKSANGDLKFGGRLKAAQSCPFVHVQSAEECPKSKFQSRLSLWTDGDAGPGSYLHDEVTVRSPHHSLRLSTDLLLISQSRCDNPVVRDLLNDESSLELVDEFSPSASSLSPRPASLAISPKSVDVASVRSHHEEAIFGVEAIHQYLIRSPPPMLARGIQRENVFVFPASNPKKTARCMSEVNFTPTKAARIQQPAASGDSTLQSLPATPHKGKDRNWVGRSAPDMSNILTPAYGCQKF